MNFFFPLYQAQSIENFHLIYSFFTVNLGTSADDLFPLFDKYGKVVDIFIPRDRRFISLYKYIRPLICIGGRKNKNYFEKWFWDFKIIRIILLSDITAFYSALTLDISFACQMIEVEGNWIRRKKIILKWDVSEE